MRGQRVALWGLIGTLLFAAAPPAATALPRDEYGLTVLLTESSEDQVGAELKKLLRNSGRFHLVLAPGIAIAAKLPDLVPDPPLSAPQIAALKQKTPGRWILYGQVQKALAGSASESVEAAGPYLVSLRVYDLDLADMGPLLSIRGQEPVKLAKQVLKFLRAQYPLAGRVTAVCTERVGPLINERDFSQRSGFVARAADLVRCETEFEPLVRW